MSMKELIGFGFTVSIFLGVMAVGMRIAPTDLPYVLLNRSRLVRAFLAMGVLAPAAAILVSHMFSLHPAVTLALLTLSIAPVGSLFSANMAPLVTPGHAAYARGLFFASTVLSVILTPLAVEVIQRIYSANVHLNPLAVAKIVFGSVLLPLGIGFAISHFWPAARRWIPEIQKVSSALILVCGVLVIAGTWSLMGSVLREGTLIAIVLLSLIWLAIGHFLGGPDEDDRTVLAFATASRHPAIALAVASLVDQPLAPIGVLLTVLVSSLAMAPYKMWRKHARETPGKIAGRSPPTRTAH